MADIIRALKDTPLPTLFLAIGFVMLCVGFGLRFRAVVDVGQLNKTYAKLIGTVFLLFGLVPYVSSFGTGVLFHRSQDPFLLYYLASVPIIVGLYWTVLRYNNGEAQIRAARLAFLLTGALVTMVVLWRAMDVYFYLNATDRLPGALPVGLKERQSYLPYLAILGAGVAASLWAIFANTQEQPNRANRSRVLEYFVWFCVYLAVLRLAWEFIDYAAKAQLPPG